MELMPMGDALDLTKDLIRLSPSVAWLLLSLWPLLIFLNLLPGAFFNGSWGYPPKPTPVPLFFPLQSAVERKDTLRGRAEECIKTQQSFSWTNPTETWCSSRCWWSLACVLWLWLSPQVCAPCNSLEKGVQVCECAFVWRWVCEGLTCFK